MPIYDYKCSACSYTFELLVREALTKLQAEGLVVVEPNRGAFVARLSVDEVREIFDLRVLLEGDALPFSLYLLATRPGDFIAALGQRRQRGLIGGRWAIPPRAVTTRV